MARRPRAALRQVSIPARAHHKRASSPAGSRAQVAACVQIVAHVGEERAPRRRCARAASIASASEKCVGCGRSRSASSTSTSRSLEQRPGRVGDPAAVGQIREAADAEAENRPAAVPERNRLHVQVADAERPDDAEAARAAAARRPSASPDRRRSRTCGGCPRASARRRSTASRRCCSALNRRTSSMPEDVIGVAVREEDRVDAADVVASAPARAGPGPASTRTLRVAAVST